MKKSLNFLSEKCGSPVYMYEILKGVI